MQFSGYDTLLLNGLITLFSVRRRFLFQPRLYVRKSGNDISGVTSLAPEFVERMLNGDEPDVISPRRLQITCRIRGLNNLGCCDPSGNRWRVFPKSHFLPWLVDFLDLSK